MNFTWKKKPSKRKQWSKKKKNSKKKTKPWSGKRKKNWLFCKKNYRKIKKLERKTSNKWKSTKSRWKRKSERNKHKSSECKSRTRRKRCKIHKTSKRKKLRKNITLRRSCSKRFQNVSSSIWSRNNSSATYRWASRWCFWTRKEKTAKSTWKSDPSRSKWSTAKSDTLTGGTLTSYPTVTTLSRTCPNSTLRQESFPLWIKRMILFGTLLSIHSLEEDSWPPRLWLTCLTIQFNCQSLERMIIVESLLLTWCPRMKLARRIFARKWMMKFSLSPKSSLENPSFSISWSKRPKFHPISNLYLLSTPSKWMSLALTSSKLQT